MKPSTARVLSEGLIAGVIGYATVVLFYIIYNVVQGQSVFHTPALLGTALFWRGAAPGNQLVTAAPVIAYNGLHLLAWLIIGVIAAWLFHETEKHHPIWYLVFFIFLAGFLFSMAAVGVFAAELTGVLPWWTIVVTNLLAGLTAGTYLWRAHAGLFRALEQEAE